MTITEATSQGRPEGLHASCVEALKTILWWVSCDNAEGLPTPTAMHRRLVASMVLDIPAVGTPSAGAMDGEVASWRTRGLAWIVTAALHRWCHTVNGSFVDRLWERVALPGVIVPNKLLCQPHAEGLEDLLPANSLCMCYLTLLYQCCSG